MPDCPRCGPVVRPNLPEDFRGPDLKLQRAETHITDLNAVMQRFMEAQSYTVHADFDLKPGYISWVVKGEEVFAHDEFAPVIGDAIHNMRDALDIAVCTIMRNANRRDSGVSFLTSDSSERFRDALHGANAPNFPQNLIDVLEARIQPYVGGNGHSLRSLHRLAIMDKHRLVVPTIFGTGIVYFGMMGMHYPIVHRDPISVKDGAVLAELARADFPYVQAGQQANVSLKVAFDERCGVLSGREVVASLFTVFNATKEAIEALRTCL